MGLSNYSGSSMNFVDPPKMGSKPYYSILRKVIKLIRSRQSLLPRTRCLFSKSSRISFSLCRIITPTTPINNTANTIGISIRFIKYLYGCINTSPVSGFTAKPSTNNKTDQEFKKKTRNKIVSGINCFRLLATISGSSILLIK